MTCDTSAYGMLFGGSLQCGESLQIGGSSNMLGTTCLQYAWDVFGDVWGILRVLLWYIRVMSGGVCLCLGNGWLSACVIVWCRYCEFVQYVEVFMLFDVMAF